MGCCSLLRYQGSAKVTSLGATGELTTVYHEDIEMILKVETHGQIQDDVINQTLQRRLVADT